MLHRGCSLRCMGLQPLRRGRSLREVEREARHQLRPQRWHAPVVHGREAGEHCGACVHRHVLHLRRDALWMRRACAVDCAVDALWNVLWDALWNVLWDALWTALRLTAPERDTACTKSARGSYSSMGGAAAARSCVPTRHLRLTGTPPAAAAISSSMRRVASGRRISAAPKSAPPASTDGQPQLRLSSE